MESQDGVNDFLLLCRYRASKIKLNSKSPSLLKVPVQGPGLRWPPMAHAPCLFQRLRAGKGGSNWLASGA